MQVPRYQLVANIDRYLGNAHFSSFTHTHKHGHRQTLDRGGSLAAVEAEGARVRNLSEREKETPTATT